MAIANTETSYGTISKTFHWVTALLILTLFPLGVIAERLPFETGEELARKAQLFSVHKTLGVLVFFVALLRILWALSQTRPGLLNADKRLEARLAELIHGLLYLSLVLVPLSGWLHHAATEGFAPILWPFGQALPFVPRSDAVAGFFSAWHWLLTKVLLAALLLHIAGALKHALIDRDGTLARMWFGRPVAAVPPSAAHSRAPFLGALAIYLLALAGASAMGLRYEGHSTPTPARLAEVQSDWRVEDGTIAITVSQLGSPLSGNFEDWTAAIAFSETAVEGRHGDVTVEIAIGSLSLGGVTSQALASDFFAVETFPTATYVAELVATETGYIAEGTLTLRGVTVPVSFPFDLEIEGETAQMAGQVQLDRRSFEIGQSQSDESAVGFAVDVDLALTATRAVE